MSKSFLILAVYITLIGNPVLNVTATTHGRTEVGVVKTILRLAENGKVKVKYTEYSSVQHASPLRELTCHMESYSITFLTLPQPKLVLD